MFITNSQEIKFVYPTLEDRAFEDMRTSGILRGAELS